MRYCELFEADEPSADQTFYHVTTDNRLKSIRELGLDPGRHRRWRNAFGAILGERGFVYLISDYDEAIKFAAKMDYYLRLEKKRHKTVILELRDVPRDGLKRDDNIEGQLARHTWWKSSAPILPGNITRVIPLTSDLIQRVVADSNAKTDEPTEAA